MLLRSGSSEEGILNRPVPDLLASSNIDIGKVCEDSCLLVAAAYMHHTSTPDQPLYRVFVPPEAVQQLNGDISSTPASVVVILDIMPGNWRLVALPGALQRIVMNLVGNSLKYTTSGFIRVKLDIQPILGEAETQTESDPGSALVELNVIDSGRGISNEFLKTKLFSPFSQETILAPGTGKYLSTSFSKFWLNDSLRSWITLGEEFGTDAPW
jgi:signal transduction histidine kinase